MKKEQQPELAIAEISTLEAPALGRLLVTSPERPPESYWDIVGRQFRKNKLAVFGLIVVIGLFGLALGADFVANDKPLVMRYEGQLYFPVLRDYAVWLGLARWQSQFQNVSYKEFVTANFKDADWAWFPPI